MSAPSGPKSGWCIDGYHRANESTVGCRGEFTGWQCSCPCHAPDAADDPRWDSPIVKAPGAALDDGEE